MPEIDQTELHSEEVQEIMGKIPGWILRWGLTIIFSIILLLVTGSYFFRFPEIVKAPLIITTYNTPAILKTSTGGKIEKILVVNEQIVNKGDVIAVIKNSADYGDILAVDTLLSQFGSAMEWDNLVTCNNFNQIYSLGALQNIYINFQKNNKQFRHYLHQNLLPLKIKLLKEQISRQYEILEKTLKQYELEKQDIGLAHNSFKRDSILYNMDLKALNKAAYESSLQAYIQKKAAGVSFEKTLKTAELNILELKENLVELKLQHERELNQYRLALDESWQLLKSSIDQWKEKYVIISPIKGKITFTSYWSINQVVNAGDRLATVVPLDETRIIAKAVISPVGLGKVQKGQVVHIKLAGFPFMQYGMLKGVLSSVSLVPEEEGYIALIDITDGMETTYKEQLKFHQEMSGTAEIITEKKRLISRFIKPLRMIHELKAESFTHTVDTLNN
jgi:multidrug efflux pump subunit AcrA (membrane-fusion protein)